MCVHQTGKQQTFLPSPRRGRALYASVLPSLMLLKFNVTDCRAHFSDEPLLVIASSCLRCPRVHVRIARRTSVRMIFQQIKRVLRYLISFSTPFNSASWTFPLTWTRTSWVAILTKWFQSQLEPRNIRIFNCTEYSYYARWYLVTLDWVRDTYSWTDSCNGLARK